MALIIRLPPAYGIGSRLLPVSLRINISLWSSTELPDIFSSLIWCPERQKPKQCLFIHDRGPPLPTQEIKPANCLLTVQRKMAKSRSNCEHLRSQKESIFMRWETKQGLNASEYWNYIQQVARKRRPKGCPCCSVSAGFVSRQLFANMLAITTS